MGGLEARRGRLRGGSAIADGHVASVNLDFYPEDPTKPEFRPCSRTRKGCPRATASPYPAKDPILMEDFWTKGPIRVVG